VALQLTPHQRRGVQRCADRGHLGHRAQAFGQAWQTPQCQQQSAGGGEKCSGGRQGSGGVSVLTDPALGHRRPQAESPHGGQQRREKPRAGAAAHPPV